MTALKELETIEHTSDDDKAGDLIMQADINTGDKTNLLALLYTASKLDYLAALFDLEDRIKESANRKEKV